MTNIASALKAEIARVARKELKRETQGLKAASARYRSEIVALKRDIAVLKKSVTRLAKPSRGAVVQQSADQDDRKYRFSAKRLAAHRKRLELSAEALGKLIGVTGLSIYNWESGKARPRAHHMPAIAALRTLSPRQAADICASRQ